MQDNTHDNTPTYYWCRRCRRYVAIDGANRDAPQVRDDPVDDVAQRLLQINI